MSKFTTDRPTQSGWYEVIWMPGDEPASLYLEVTEDGITWRDEIHDDPEALELDIDRPEEIQFKKICEKCVKSHWACPKCGAAPISWNGNETPDRCKNIFCENTEFVFKSSFICCQRYNHHLGSTCPHCGQKG